MESGPPLNLSTSVKVKDDSEQVNSKIIEEHVKSEIVIYLQIEDKETQALTITGEAVEETNSADESIESPKSPTTYKCLSCPNQFPRASQLRHHAKSHVEDKVHKCKHCSMQFSRYNLLAAHLKEHVAKRCYSCDVCKIPLSTYTNYRNHMKKHQRNLRKFKCNECPMRFTQQSHLSTHMRKHTGEKPFICGICQTKFKQVSHLTTHLRIHSNDRPYVCDVCNAAFSQTGSLKRHKRSHTGEKPYKCEQCDSVFVEKRNLSRHLLSHSGIRPFSCDLCSATFTQLIDLKRHKLSHSGIKPFKCDICELAFSRKNNLKWHKLTHEGNTPHVCEICNVGFRIPKDLKSHKRTHIENRPYACKLCKASFAQLNTLRRHSLVHSGKKPFSCDHCPATFYEKSSAKRHMQRHINVKPYACDQCSTTFLELRAFKRHKIIVHNEGRYEDTADNIAEVPEVGSSNNHVIKNQSHQEENNLQIYEPLKIRTNKEPTLLPKQDDSFSEVAISNGVDNTSQFIFGADFNNQSNCQVPTLLLSQPGQPPKAGRPVGDCQNHESHVHTLIESSYNQWQAWCFCDLTTPSSVNSQEMVTNDQATFSNIAPLTVSSQPLPSIPHVNQLSIPQQVHINADTSSIMSKKELLDSHSKAMIYQSLNSNNQQDDLQTDNSYHDYSVPYSSSHLLPVPVLNANPNDIETNVIESPQTSSVKMISNVKYSYMDSENIGAAVTNSNQYEYSTSEIKKSYGVKEEMNIENKMAIANADISSTMNANLSQDIIDDSSKPSSSITKFINTSTISSGTFVYDENTYTSMQNVSKPETDCHLKDSHDEQTPNVLMKDNLNSLNYNSITQTSSVEGKDHVTLQYSLTVNNPATGKIQIQSDHFPVKKVDPIPEKVHTKRCKEKKFDCQYCSKFFAKLGQLDLHIRTHTGDKPFTCGLCNIKFTHNNSLTIHMRSHTGERPYACDECDATFTQKSNLRVHLRTHTGEKPFKCDTCEVSFSQGSHLKAHKRIHSNDRPFVCPTCGQAFTQRSALKRHQLKHTGVRAHTCPKCFAKFSQKDDLRKHIFSHTKAKKKLESQDLANKISENKIISKQTGSNTHDKNIDKVNNTLETQPSSEFNENMALKPIELSKFSNPVDDTSAKLEKLRDVSGEDVKAQVHCENIDCNTIKPENIKKTFESQKSSPTSVESNEIRRSPTIEPIRTSRRIREAAERKKNTIEYSDYITGDLTEIDKIEALEDEIAKSHLLKKISAQKVDSNQEVQSWCFCEVRHGPNEPHTQSSINLKDAAIDSHLPQEPKSISDSVSCIINTGDVSRTDKGEIISTFNLPQTAVIIQPGDENMSSYNSGDHVLNHNLSQIMSSASLIDGSNITVQGTDAQINATEPESQLLSAQQDDISHSKDDYNPAQVMSNQVLTGNQFITADGTYFIDANDLIGNGAVVLNSAPGTFLFDIGPEGQLLNVPMNSNLASDVIVAGTTVIEASGNAYTPPTSSSISNNVATVLPDSSTILGTTNVGVASVGLNNIQYASLDNSVMYDHVNELSLESTEKKVIKHEGTKSVVLVPCKCTICFKVFAQKITLKGHMENDHPDFHYCTICCESFTSKENLKTHKLRHQKTCQDCLTSFPTKNSLSQHRQKVHNVGGRYSGVKKDQQRSIVCNQCDSRFYQISDLKRHTLSHTGEKPFKCKACNSSFTRKFSLKKHERIHTGEKPYACHLCPKAFTYRHQYNRHCATVHVGQPKENPNTSSTSFSTQFFS